MRTGCDTVLLVGLLEPPGYLGVRCVRVGTEDLVRFGSTNVGRGDEGREVWGGGSEGTMYDRPYARHSVVDRGERISWDFTRVKRNVYARGRNRRVLLALGYLSRVSVRALIHRGALIALQGLMMSARIHECHVTP